MADETEGRPPRRRGVELLDPSDGEQVARITSPSIDASDDGEDTGDEPTGADDDRDAGDWVTRTQATRPDGPPFGRALFSSWLPPRSGTGTRLQRW